MRKIQDDFPVDSIQIRIEIRYYEINSIARCFSFVGRRSSFVATDGFLEIQEASQRDPHQRSMEYRKIQ